MPTRGCCRRRAPRCRTRSRFRRPWAAPCLEPIGARGGGYVQAQVPVRSPEGGTTTGPWRADAPSENVEAEPGVGFEAFHQCVTECARGSPESSGGRPSVDVEERCGGLSQHLGGRAVAGVLVAGHLRADLAARAGAPDEADVEPSGLLLGGARTLPGRGDHLAEQRTRRSEARRPGEGGESGREP